MLRCAPHNKKTLVRSPCLDTFSIENNESSENYKQLCDSIITTLLKYFPEENSMEKMIQLRKVVSDSYAIADETFQARDAEKWGGNFKVSNDIVIKDESLFQASMRDLTAMTRQNQLSKDRLNRDRVERHVRLDNPERVKLLLLADRGMPILLRPGFRANGQGKLPILRKTYVSVKSVRVRLLYSLPGTRLGFPSNRIFHR